MPEETEPPLIPKRERLKFYPQVKFLGTSFDRQLTSQGHFEELLYLCKPKYHHLSLLVDQKWEPSPSTALQIYND